MRYTNVSNPAAFGTEWVAGETGNRYQLVNSRGTSTLMFGVKNESEGRNNWVSTVVVAPERFGLKSPPKTYKEFLAIVRNYVEA